MTNTVNRVSGGKTYNEYLHININKTKLDFLVAVAFAAWPVLTPGLFTPCLPDTWNHETLLHTDQAAFLYLGVG